MFQNVRSECLQLQQRVEELEKQNHRLQLLVQQTFNSLAYSTLHVSSCVSRSVTGFVMFVFEAQYFIMHVKKTDRFLKILFLVDLDVPDYQYYQVKWKHCINHLIYVLLCSSCLCCKFPILRLSVCLSHSCIVLKRQRISPFLCILQPHVSPRSC